MSKYYSLPASLPELTPEMTKLPFTVASFKAEIADILIDKDSKLLEWLFYKYDNANLLLYLRKATVEGFDENAVLSADELKELCETLKNEDRKPAFLSSAPDYMVDFIRTYYARFETGGGGHSSEQTLLEDKLSSSYFDAAICCDNPFVAAWFELNLNISNVMVALNCRKYGLDQRDFIVGDNEVAERLRQSVSRDLNLADTADYMPELLNIAEEQDLMQREKRFDALRWKWLDDNTFYKTFDFEAIITYLLRLEMLERWLRLDKVSGEQTFRHLVGDMKSESARTLSRFRDKGV